VPICLLNSLPTTTLKQNQNTNQWPDELDALIAWTQRIYFLQVEVGKESIIQKTGK